MKFILSDVHFKEKIIYIELYTVSLKQGKFSYIFAQYIWKSEKYSLVETFSIYTGMKENKLHFSTLTYYCRHKNIPVGSHSQKSPTQGDMNDDFNRRWT